MGRLYQIGDRLQMPEFVRSDLRLVTVIGRTETGYRVARRDGTVLEVAPGAVVPHVPVVALVHKTGGEIEFRATDDGVAVHIVVTRPEAPTMPQVRAWASRYPHRPTVTHVDPSTDPAVEPA